MKKLTGTFLLLLLLLLVFGCSTHWIGVPNVSAPDSTEYLDTKAEIYQAWGAPENVIHAEGYQYLVFQSARLKGGGFGIGNLMLAFWFLNSHTMTDIYVVQLDEQDQVVKIHALKTTPQLKYRIWPF